MGLTKQQALEMLESDDLVGLGMAAHQMRLKKNDPRVVTYQIDRNINYTNFCTEYCSFCAFYRPLGAKDVRKFAPFAEAAFPASAPALFFRSGNSLHRGSFRN